MKKINFFLLIALFTALYSCDYATIAFKNPQPNDKPSMDKIPLLFRGKYINLSDSTVLSIDKYSITLLNVDKSIFKNDSSITSKDSTAISDGKILYSADDLEKKSSVSSVFLDLTNGGTLKHFRGAYFISSRKNDSEWEVSRLKKTLDGVAIGYCNTKTDLGLLGGITGVTINTKGNNVFDPTKEQFKEFLRQGGFRSMHYYFKLKEK